jgi:hypothetical protein
MRILLDTHVFLWALAAIVLRLADEAQQALERLGRMCGLRGR